MEGHVTVNSMPEHPFRMRVPEGDNRPRSVCDQCGFIDYVNPKVVVGAVCTWGDEILMCRRSIEPRSGYWTIPAGFLEEGETTAEGAAREAREEALADIRIDSLLGIYNIARISQVYLVYRATLASPDVGVGEETAEVQFVTPDRIPWDDLAFESVDWALRRFLEVRGEERYVPFQYP